MFLSRIVVSLRMPGLQEKSLVKIASPSTIVAWSILQANWFACCATLELLSPSRTVLLCPFNLVSKALSVCPYNIGIAIDAADLV